MALINIISKEIINGFIPMLCEAHGLTKEDVLKTWNTYLGKETTPEKKPRKQKEKVDDGTYTSMTLKVLHEKCRARKLKLSGTKSQVIKRLEEADEGGSSEAEAKVEPKKTTKKTKPPPILEPTEIVLEKDEYGNMVHKATKLVFNKEKIVIGILNEEDDLDILCSESMEICKQHGFKYEIPETF